MPSAENNDVTRYSSRRLWEMLNALPRQQSHRDIPALDKTLRQELERRNPGDGSRRWTHPH